ncbi:hypothetical protein ACFQV2_20480 [Actinokineospora soli]|uniref:Uncharacterized protein n=1 Tax=Actinokineospora soli TaxID=1048753 RepID=A0ABW2TR94_9PSEU
MFDWLAVEPELRGRVRYVDAEVGAGELGALSDVLVVGGAVTALAVSLREYFTQRAGVKVVVSGPRGRVEIDAERARDIEALVRDLRDLDGREA